MDIIEQVRSWAESECKKPTSKYGYEPYEYHFIPMVKRATDLAKKVGADVEIVQVAGWLHDMGSILEGREDHHISGARIAERKLLEFGYPLDKIEIVKKCIFNHRGSKDYTRESLEEIVIAEADALCNFDNIGGIFKAAYTYENLSQGEAVKSTLEKLERKYKQLHLQESKDLALPKMEAARLLLSQD